MQSLFWDLSDLNLCALNYSLVPPLSFDSGTILSEQSKQIKEKKTVWIWKALSFAVQRVSARKNTTLVSKSFLFAYRKGFGAKN